MPDDATITVSLPPLGSFAPLQLGPPALQAVGLLAVVHTNKTDEPKGTVIGPSEPFAVRLTVAPGTAAAVENDDDSESRNAPLQLGVPVKGASSYTSYPSTVQLYVLLAPRESAPVIEYGAELSINTLPPTRGL